jgi:hypothetical protein
VTGQQGSARRRHGRLDPADLPLSRRYGEAWAVVRAAARVPPGWDRGFANRDWAIWRIGPVAGRSR